MGDAMSDLKGCTKDCRFTPVGLIPAVYHAEGCPKRDEWYEKCQKPLNACICSALQKPAPATDEEIADCQNPYHRCDEDCEYVCKLIASLVARIDAEKEKVSALKAERAAWQDRHIKECQTVLISVTAENANLRALNAEMLAALTAMVDAALTDSDACSICLHGCPGHISGCAKASAEALLAKAKAAQR